MANVRGDIVVRIAAALLAVILSLMPSSTLRQPSEHGSPGDVMPFVSFSKTLQKIAATFPGDSSNRPLSFPFDHGVHRDAPMEIWEFTGQMNAPDGYRYGFQLSLTRLGLQPDDPERVSAWATRDVYRGLFTFLYASNGQYRAFERFARAALNMSGYDPASGLVWLDNWKMQVPSGESPSFALQAEAEETRLDLRLEPQKAVVVPSAESFPAAAGGRLRAYVLSRLAVSGTVQFGGHRRSVTGHAWLNRSWGKIAPPGGQVALNRYQLQLDDGRELLIFQLRRKDGSSSPLSSGLLIEADGRALPISRNEIWLEPGDYWSSDAGTRYPVSWIVKLPGISNELRLSPLVENQEAVRSVRSWSGSVSVSGTGPRGEPLSGQGFIELTGY
ncbi:lipocalin-like domain-containing protein [Methylocaldum sp.]|uniref:lipocalin-like domain-containing protein n=1 Tax=Methylocaldum sp. TaxID=1969727 RepID=UPI002D6FAD52|nr:lipocalin-like domain-containing protein [Methylocaldum sp.]HYE34559.1 lipocalin-like domain-containing protein [Methylocaldum sp.]